MKRGFEIYRTTASPTSFDATGALLKAQGWPDDIANSIKSVEVKADGGVKVKLASKLSARRVILERTGELKSTGTDSVDALAAAIRAVVDRHTK